MTLCSVHLILPFKIGFSSARGVGERHGRDQYRTRLWLCKIESKKHCDSWEPLRQFAYFVLFSNLYIFACECYQIACLFFCFIYLLSVTHNIQCHLTFFSLKSHGFDKADSGMNFTLTWLSCHFTLRNAYYIDCCQKYLDGKQCIK